MSISVRGKNRTLLFMANFIGCLRKSKPNTSLVRDILVEFDNWLIPPKLKS